MIINANALHIPLADKSVQMICTSPPYWGLRDYGTAKWEGGDPECKHNPQKPDGGERSDRALPLGRGGLYRSICGKCGAIRIDNQLGLERTPEEYIANMVSVFRECWRVLRDDGTLWLNCGDSYAGGSRDSNPNGKQGTNRGTVDFDPGHFKGFVPNGLKPKDLCGIPWRLAFALQADGWYLRSDIIWSKPNPMPESVTDRPTKSHEYLFLLAKQERYYYDQEAIREGLSETTLNDPRMNDMGRTYDGKGRGAYGETGRANGSMESWVLNPSGRNRRTVWTIPTAPYKGAHFATFPPALVEPCIKAGTSERGCCPKCGKGWRRVTEKSKQLEPQRNVIGLGPKTVSGGGNGTSLHHIITTDTLGWQPSCTCDAGDPIPCLVFDPFVGSGTTVKVAYDLGRRGVGLDLSLNYLDEQARKRIHNGHIARLF